MKVHTFESKIWLPQPIDDIFLFFADARNLQRITPPFLKFTVISPAPITMARGARIRYRLRLHGIPISWESEITAREPPHGFVDEQRHRTDCGDTSTASISVMAAPRLPITWNTPFGAPPSSMHFSCREMCAPSSTTAAVR